MEKGNERFHFDEKVHFYMRTSLSEVGIYEDIIDDDDHHLMKRLFRQSSSFEH